MADGGWHTFLGATARAAGTPSAPLLASPTSSTVADAPNGRAPLLVAPETEAKVLPIVDSILVLLIAVLFAGGYMARSLAVWLLAWQFCLVLATSLRLQVTLRDTLSERAVQIYKTLAFMTVAVKNVLYFVLLLASLRELASPTLVLNGSFIMGLGVFAIAFSALIPVILFGTASLAQVDPESGMPLQPTAAMLGIAIMCVGGMFTSFGIFSIGVIVYVNSKWSFVDPASVMLELMLQTSLTCVLPNAYVM